jgi:hypothetical protein
MRGRHFGTVLKGTDVGSLVIKEIGPAGGIGKLPALLRVSSGGSFELK